MRETGTALLGAVRLAAATAVVLGTATLLFFLTFRARPYDLAGERAPIRDDLLALAARGESVWAVGHHGRILHTSDGGRRWTFQESAIRTPLSGVDFLDGATGLAVGYEGVILRTTDGGTTWRRVPSGVDVYLTTVRFLPDGRAFAAGEWGTILASEDRGERWSIVTSGEHDFIINDFDLLPEGAGWAVGELGRALHTDDGGRTWSARDLGVDETTLFGVDVVSDAEVWVSGMDSLLLHSTDGGASWERRTAPCERTQLLRIRLAGERGYVVGRRCVLVTGDGGRTWERSTLLGSLRHSWLYGLEMTAEGVWAAGYAESIFRGGQDDRSWQRVTIGREGGAGSGRFDPLGDAREADA